MVLEGQGGRVNWVGLEGQGVRGAGGRVNLVVLEGQGVRVAVLDGQGSRRLGRVSGKGARWDRKGTFFFDSSLILKRLKTKHEKER